MKKMILLMLLCLIIATGCSTKETTTGQDFGITGFETGKHVFFLFTSTH